MKVLITGINGFVGSHLTDYLLRYQPKAKICGFIENQKKLFNIKHVLKYLKLYQVDLRSRKRINYLIKKIKPDKVFHLAAQPSTKISFLDPAGTLEINIIGTANLLEALKNIKSKAITHVAGSIYEYGKILSKENPIKENQPLRPTSFYEISKIGQSLLAYYYNYTFKMKIIYTRATNHTGPKQNEIAICSRLAKNIAEIEAGFRRPKIIIFNSKTIRDFLDVRDVVRAYWLATEKCRPGEVYNLGIGRGYSLRQILKTLIGLSTAKIIFKERFLPKKETDSPKIIVDNRKFIRATAWQPKIDFLKQTLPDLLNWWRKKITKQG